MWRCCNNNTSCIFQYYPRSPADNTTSSPLGKPMTTSICHGSWHRPSRHMGDPFKITRAHDSTFVYTYMGSKWLQLYTINLKLKIACVIILHICTKCDQSSYLYQVWSDFISVPTYNYIANIKIWKAPQFKFYMYGILVLINLIYHIEMSEITLVLIYPFLLFITNIT